MAQLEFDLSGVERLGTRLRELEDRLADVMPGALEDIRQVWSGAVWGDQLPGMERKVYHPYYRDDLGPESVVYPIGGDQLAGRVHPDRQEIAARVEHGRESRDMKPGFLNSPKARDGKQGRYLRIPLGFGMSKPGIMRPDLTGHIPFGTSLFRTVSDASPANSWIYPAIPGTAVIEAVVHTVEPRVTDRVRQVIEEWRQ
jgi:hypothetical protein